MSRSKCHERHIHIFYISFIVVAVVKLSHKKYLRNRTKYIKDHSEKSNVFNFLWQLFYFQFILVVCQPDKRLNQRLLLFVRNVILV